MYSILCLMCLLLSGLPCWLCFSLDAGFTIFMGGMETPPLCWGQRVLERLKTQNRQKTTRAQAADGHCGIPVLPVTQWQLRRGHQLRVPQDPPPAPIATYMGVRSKHWGGIGGGGGQEESTQPIERTGGDGRWKEIPGGNGDSGNAEVFY